MIKKFTLIMAIAFMSFCASSQSISPNEATEFCPLVNVTFTVTLPRIKDGSAVNVYSWTNTPILVSGVSNLTNTQTQTTFTFAGRFTDANINQVFKVDYTPNEGSATFYLAQFKNIKSLALTNTVSQSCLPLQPNQTLITAPLCQVVNVPISFSNIKWSTFGESPAYCFGTITTYEYQLPVGWSIGSTTSMGSNWIQGSNSVTITTDQTTGNNMTVKIRPANDCAPGLVNGQTPVQIPISRPAPAFSLSPTSVEIECGTSKTQTFTVSMTGATTCAVTYSWYLGDNNGWMYNSSPAPTTAFTGPASITLTSLASNSNFSNVTVTPMLDGIAQSPLTATTKFKAPNLGLVGGSNSICSGTSAPFYLYNAPSNVYIYWSTTTILPNYGATVVSIDNQYSSSTTLTKINSGVINLTASMTDGCNQTYSITRQNILVGGYANTSSVAGYTLAYPPCYTQGCTPTAVSNPISSSGPYGTTVYSGRAYTNTSNSLYLYNSELSSGTWSLNTGTVSWWYSSNGNNLQFYPSGTGYVQFRLTNYNTCGVQYYDFNFYPVQYNQTNYYRVAPNPATDELIISIDEEKMARQNNVKSSEQDIREIVIIDKMGQARYRQKAGKGTRQMKASISNLPAGSYLVRIFNGKDWRSLQFIKQ